MTTKAAAPIGRGQTLGQPIPVVVAAAIPPLAFVRSRRGRDPSPSSPERPVLRSFCGHNRWFTTHRFADSSSRRSLGSFAFANPQSGIAGSEPIIGLVRFRHKGFAEPAESSTKSTKTDGETEAN